MRLSDLAFPMILVIPLLGFAEDKGSKTKKLFNGKDLTGWKTVTFGGEGKISVEDGQLIIGRGETLSGVKYPEADFKLNYEIKLEAKKLEGNDFFCGLTFPVAESHASFIVGGWAGGVVGISSINGYDASENETTQYRTFESNKWYKFRVRVTKDRIQTWIDDEAVVNVKTEGKRISTRIEVDEFKPLGLGTWQTKAALREIEWRPLTEAEIAEEAAKK